MPGGLSFGCMRARTLAAVAALTLALAGSGCAAAGMAGTPTVNDERTGTSAGTAGGTVAGTAAGTAGPASSTSDAVTGASAITTPAMPVTTRTVTSTVTASTGASTTASSTGTSATDLSGEVYGFVTAVDPARSELTVDKIDWFTGAAAQQACAQDGVTGTDNNRCSGWYYRNVNPALRVVAVAPDAAISTLNGGTRSVPGDLPTVAAEIARNGGHSPWRLVVTDGRVTELQEIYLP